MADEYRRPRLSRLLAERPPRVRERSEGYLYTDEGSGVCPACGDLAASFGRAGRRAAAVLDVREGEAVCLSCLGVE